MNSYKPYLIRALHEWISDNGMTPHLLVDATVEGVIVPPTAVSEGRVILNVAHRATVAFRVDDAYVSFSARFNRVSHEVWVPIRAVLAIYARENGQGMAIPEDPHDDATLDAALDAGEAAIEAVVKDSQPMLSSVPSADEDTSSPEDTPPPPKKGGHLRVVK